MTPKTASVSRLVHLSLIAAAFLACIPLDPFDPTDPWDPSDPSDPSNPANDPGADAGAPFIARDAGSGRADAGGSATGRYVLYGEVSVAAQDCPEGSSTWEDDIAYYTQVVDGPYSDTFGPASAALKARMQADHPGARYYRVESSWFTYGKTARHLVVIGYTYKVSYWNCRPSVLTYGFGQTYEEALSSALEKKNDSSDSRSVPYLEETRVNW